MTKVIQISDPQIMPDGQLAYGQFDKAAAPESCVETVNWFLPDIDPVDMAFVAGDLTDSGTEEEYQRFPDVMEPPTVPYRAFPGQPR